MHPTPTSSAATTKSSHHTNDDKPTILTCRQSLLQELELLSGATRLGGGIRHNQGPFARVENLSNAFPR